MIADNPFLRHARTERSKINNLFPDISQNIFLDGILKDSVDFVLAEQLLDRGLWKKLVEQYRLFSDSDKSEWRGEYWGKMMRGAAFVLSVTRDRELYGVLEDTVRDLLTAQDAHGRFSTYSTEVEFTKWDMWCRKYILLGMLCFYPLCEDEELKAQMTDAMKRHADYIIDRVGPKAQGKMPITMTSVAAEDKPVHGAMNSLSILEPMVLLYRLTGEKRYLDFSGYIVNDGVGEYEDSIFELAYEDKIPPYQYPHTKAYEMMSCFEGLLEYALETGNEKWKNAAVRFAYRLMETDITVMGSAGTAHEFLNHASVRQTVYKGIGQETCVSVTWMKLCARMLLVTGDPIFADCFEQTLYNAYLGTFNTHRICNHRSFSKGFFIEGLDIVPTCLPFDSYTPLLGGSRGRGIGGGLLFGDGTYYGCCACIGAAGIGIAPHLVCMRRKDGFAVMLYADGTYRTVTQGGTAVQFKVEGNYPFGDSVRIILSLERSEEFTLSLRIPSWSVNTSLTVNGEQIDTNNGMTSVTRMWNDGDMVELCFDMRVEALRPTVYHKDIIRSRIIWRTCEMVSEEETADPATRNHVVFRRGPVILACEDMDTHVSIEGNEDTYISYETLEDKDVGIALRLDNGLRLVDSASAGKEWNESSVFTVWIKNSN
ncbi:MAG: glycoside hydrolase family 127 protein [Clostridia bacterium]|nr:glycoside hydrolase family 127 protein [Clostridia bacterium]